MADGRIIANTVQTKYAEEIIAALNAVPDAGDAEAKDCPHGRKPHDGYMCAECHVASISETRNEAAAREAQLRGALVHLTNTASEYAQESECHCGHTPADEYDGHPENVIADRERLYDDIEEAESALATPASDAAQRVRAVLDAAREVDAAEDAWTDHRTACAMCGGGDRLCYDGKMLRMRLSEARIALPDALRTLDGKEGDAS
jgi:hypothetical protein